MKIQIINVWNELEAYIQAVENGKNPEEEWEKQVIATCWEQLCCYAPMDLSERKPGVIKDTKILTEQVKKLKEINIEGLREEFERIATVLPNYDDDPITVALFPSDAQNETVNEKQNGVIGTALFGNLIIQINPLIEQYEKWIPYVFAHEYHHTVWGNYWFMLHGGCLENKFIDALMIDGEADSFALSQYPDLKPEWIFGLSKDEVENLWNQQYKAIVQNKDVDYGTYMFGNEEAGIPWCAGYAIGYMLVQRYIEKTGNEILAMLEKKPEDILDVIW